LKHKRSISMLKAKDSHAVEREKRATELLERLTAEYRAVRALPDGVDIGASDRALLSAVASSALEIELTTARLAAGRAHSKALERLGNSRSELRRALRALRMIGDSGEQRDDPIAPPAPSEESMAEVVAAFGGTPKGVARGASEPR
jgi:hypothetical protein